MCSNSNSSKEEKDERMDILCHSFMTDEERKTIKEFFDGEYKKKANDTFLLTDEIKPFLVSSDENSKDEEKGEASSSSYRKNRQIVHVESPNAERAKILLQNELKDGNFYEKRELILSSLKIPEEIKIYLIVDGKKVKNHSKILTLPVPEEENIGKILQDFFKFKIEKAMKANDVKKKKYLRDFKWTSLKERAANLAFVELADCIIMSIISLIKDFDWIIDLGKLFNSCHDRILYYKTEEGQIKILTKTMQEKALKNDTKFPDGNILLKCLLKDHIKKFQRASSVWTNYNELDSEYKKLEENLQDWVFFPNGFASVNKKTWPLFAYGSVHLLRLLIRIPSIEDLRYIQNKRLKYIINQTNELMEFLSRIVSHFNNNYVNAN